MAPIKKPTTAMGAATKMMTAMEAATRTMTMRATAEMRIAEARTLTAAMIPTAAVILIITRIVAKRIPTMTRMVAERIQTTIPTEAKRIPMTIRTAAVPRSLRMEMITTPEAIALRRILHMALAVATLTVPRRPPVAMTARTMMIQATGRTRNQEVMEMIQMTAIAVTTKNLVC
jgi:hypothetical protein